VVLFVTELWERFAYYGMRALLILYLIDTSTGGLGWTREQASQLYGWYNGLAYLTPVAGGWLADRFLGTNRSLVVGGTLISVGHLTLALASRWSFYAGLAFIILGTGFFKPNVYTMVGQLYRERDPRRDAGFTLYYMGINLGALFGPLVCAWVAAQPGLGWPYGFAVAGFSMLIGLAFYVVTRGDRLRGVGLAPAVPAAPSTDVRRAESKLSPAERRRIIALGIITIFVVFFWLAFEQVGSSLNVFAAQRTDRIVSGWLATLVPEGKIPAAWFQAVNPLFVLLLAPLLAGTWQSMGSKAPSTQAKMALGLVLLGAAYVVMVLGAAASDQGDRVSPWYLIIFYLIYSLGELCFLPAGFSFVGQAAPARLASMLMGLWFTANFVANVLGGYLAGMTERIERGELFRILGGQADFFLIFVIICLGAGTLLFLLLPLINRLMSARAAYSPALHESLSRQ
jgi:POT family proton-dependent oligopeptide transporter